MLRRQRAIEIVPSSKPLRWRRYDVLQHLAPETSDALRFCAVEGDLDLLDRRHRSTIEAGSFVVSTGPPLARLWRMRPALEDERQACTPSASPPTPARPHPELGSSAVMKHDKRLSRVLEEVQQKLAHLRCSFDIRAVSAAGHGCHPGPRYLAGRAVGIAGLSQQVVGANDEQGGRADGVVPR